MKKLDISIADHHGGWTTYGQTNVKDGDQHYFRDLFEHSPEMLSLLKDALPIIEHARDGDRTPFFVCERAYQAITNLLKKLESNKL